MKSLSGRVRSGPARRSVPRWLGATVAAVVLVAVGFSVVTSIPPAFAAATPGCGKTPTLTQRHPHDPEQRPEPQLHPADPRRLRQQPPVPVDLRATTGRAAPPNDVAGGGTRRVSPGPTTACSSRHRTTATIFVAPQGISNGWANSDGQDVTFIDDMIRLIEDDLCVDTTQLFAMGFSYGGGMSYAIACARPTVFRAVAVYSGAQLQRMQRRHPADRVHRASTASPTTS